MHHKISNVNFPSNKHSIPILLKRSIPIGCAVALLLGMAMPAQTFAASAYCGDIDGYERVGENKYVSIDGSLETCDFRPILTTPTENTVSLTPSLALSIDNGEASVDDKIIAEYDKTNYSSHTVSLAASNVASYALTLSGVGVSGPAVLTGANNVKGAALAADTWGYGWGEATAADDEMSYESAVSKNLGDVAISNNAVDLSKKLVFATKFGENSVAGTYKVTATISAVAMPAEVTETFVKWDDLVYMQDMSAETCEYAPVGVAKTLIDIRDGSSDPTYTVKKLSDGKCWMTQNLRITKDSLKVGGEDVFSICLTKYDSDVEGTCYNDLPKSSIIGFTDDTAVNVYYNNNVSYGAYYSWCAATAGTCAVDGVPISSGEASGSVCPRGWRLPTMSEYRALINNGMMKRGVWSANSTTSGYWIGASTDEMASGAFWPAAGRNISGTLMHTGGNGAYWASNIVRNTSRAYRLDFDSTVVPQIASSEWCYGFSVRCVAR